ncbi:hypothetical protein HY623_03265 [Candidatus Uhrbacteria bacterium]|nr:hypothetical protein [Candidatus Uhrbacteria bacterium]
MKRTIFFVAVIFLGSGFSLPIPASALNACGGQPLAGTVSNPINSEGECRTKCSGLGGGYTFKEYSAGGFTGLDPSKKFTCCCGRQPAGGAVCPAGLTCLDDPLGTADIPTLIGLVLRGLFAIIGAIALIIFIYGGALWMTAFGEEAKVKRGWDTMIWGAIGLVVIFGSYVAVDFILKAILGS